MDLAPLSQRFNFDGILSPGRLSVNRPFEKTCKNRVNLLIFPRMPPDALWNFIGDLSSVLRLRPLRRQNGLHDSPGGDIRRCQEGAVQPLFQGRRRHRADADADRSLRHRTHGVVKQLHAPGAGEHQIIQLRQLLPALCRRGSVCPEGVQGDLPIQKAPLPQQFPQYGTGLVGAEQQDLLIRLRAAAQGLPPVPGWCTPPGTGPAGCHTAPAPRRWRRR